MSTIFGVILKESICDYGLQAYAIANGEVIASHISSNEAFAKADLGFAFAPDSEHHGQTRKKLYSELFPDGYKLEWLGERPKAEIEKILANNTNSNE